jgi:hypothetical protein
MVRRMMRLWVVILNSTNIQLSIGGVVILAYVIL